MENKKMNVIIVCDYAYTVGGAEKVAIESAIGLARSGVNVVFFAAVGPIDQRLVEEGIRVVCLNQSDVKTGNKIQSLCQGLWNRKAQCTFRKLLSEFSPTDTIIHAHIWQKALSSSVFYECYKKKYQIAFTMHHYFLACPNGGFYNYQKNQICKQKALSLKCICTQCDKQNYVIKCFRVLRSIIEKYIAHLPQQIKYYITISDLGKNVIEAYLPKNAKYYPIDNPFNIGEKLKVNVGKNDIYIYLGRLSPEKGVSILAELARDLHIKIVVIGDGPEREIMDSITDKLIYSGWISGEEVEEYIQQARAFIFPTLWYEGMPMSVLECSAYGVPTILPNTCSAVEVVKDGETGFVYEQGNYEDLKRCIEQSLDNDLLERISHNIYNYFYSKDYSNIRHCNELKDLYREMLKDREMEHETA